MVLSEGDLKITLPSNATGRKFDDETTHGLSHCMKAVDFIIDLEDRILFVELKDPDNPAAKTGNREEHIEKFRSGQLDSDLKSKYRDSFLYEWASGREVKPVFFFVLIAASVLSDADLLARTDALRRQIPLAGPRELQWKRPLLAGCAVMNLATWNRVLPQFPVTRMSTGLC